MKTLLIIVDAENDFITGTLAVDGAKEAMQNLISYIIWEKDSIAAILNTVELHPINHCSFSKNGGPWPVHCVNYTWGAAVAQNVSSALIEYNRSTGNPVAFIPKGMDPEREEYGAFSNAEDRDALQCELSEMGIDSICVAGIAGDYCVKETVANLLKTFPASMITMLVDCIASIDGGEALEEFIQENKLHILDTSQGEEI